MRLEVVSQVVELLEGDEDLGLSDRRLRSRLSKMSRLNRARIRGNSLKKDQERELKNKAKGSKQGPESQHASASGSQMLSGTQAGKSSVVTQKISSAKTSGPSKSLDIFQAKTDDDGEDPELYSE
jgi:Mg-chelatase subunit ChlI